MCFIWNLCSQLPVKISLKSKLFFLFETPEASGQNFREEEVEEKGCNSEVSRKRRREANYDDSSLNDQVNYRKNNTYQTTSCVLC